MAYNRLCVCVCVRACVRVCCLLPSPNATFEHLILCTAGIYSILPFSQQIFKRLILYMTTDHFVLQCSDMLLVELCMLPVKIVPKMTYSVSGEMSKLMRRNTCNSVGPLLCAIYCSCIHRDYDVDDDYLFMNMVVTSGVAGGSCPLCPMPCPRLPPSSREKKLYVPSRSFPSIVAAWSLCTNQRNVSKHCIVNAEFLFLFPVVNGKAPAASFL